MTSDLAAFFTFLTNATEVSQVPIAISFSQNEYGSEVLKEYLNTWSDKHLPGKLPFSELCYGKAHERLGRFHEYCTAVYFASSLGCVYTSMCIC